MVEVPKSASLVRKHGGWLHRPGRSMIHSADARVTRASAEWIIGRPGLCNHPPCFLTKLADFGTSTMGGDEAQVAGGNVKGVGGFTNYPINMVDPLASGGFNSLDTVGELSGQSFTATWDRAGHTVPF